MSYQGSCHCGKIAFEFDGEVGKAIECNCSLCSRRGYLLTFVPSANFTLKTDEANLSTYRFNKEVIAHHFCATCGCAPFGEGADPQGNKMFAVNLRCVEGIDPAGLSVHKVDGRSR